MCLPFKKHKHIVALGESFQLLRSDNLMQKRSNRANFLWCASHLMLTSYISDAFQRPYFDSYSKLTVIPFSSRLSSSSPNRAPLLVPNMICCHHPNHPWQQLLLAPSLPEHSVFFLPRAFSTVTPLCRNNACSANAFFYSWTQQRTGQTMCLCTTEIGVSSFLFCEGQIAHIFMDVEEDCKAVPVALLNDLPCAKWELLVEA